VTLEKNSKEIEIYVVYVLPRVFPSHS